MQNSRYEGEDGKKRVWIYTTPEVDTRVMQFEVDADTTRPEQAWSTLEFGPCTVMKFA